MKRITFGMLIINFMVFIVLSIYPNMTLSSKADDNIMPREPFFNIMTSNKAVYLMTKELVKDKHNVEYLAKTKEEINDFTFDESVTDNISSMDFFIYTGAGFEPWSNKLVTDLKKDDVSVIDISRGAKILTTDEQKQNPYYWMDFENCKIALFNIKNELQTYDPANKAYYEENYNNTITDFEDKYSKKVSLLKNLKNTNIYYTDNSLEYFAKYINSAVQFLDKEKSDKLLKNKVSDTSVILYSDEKDIEIYKANSEINNILFVKIDNYNENFDYLGNLEKTIDDVFTTLNLNTEDSE